MQWMCSSCVASITKDGFVNQENLIFNDVLISFLNNRNEYYAKLHVRVVDHLRQGFDLHMLHK